MTGSDQKNKSLYDLLTEQVAYYQRLLNLEIALTQALLENNVATISKNTREKNSIIEQTEANAAAMQPLLDAAFTEDNRLKDSRCENLRSQALDLLDQVAACQEKNLTSLVENRNATISKFKRSKQAKQVARGYKQSRSGYRTRLDTKS